MPLWATDLRVPPARTGDQDLTPSPPRARALRTHPPARPPGRLTWGHRCAAAGRGETGQGRSRRPRAPRTPAPLGRGTLTERLDSLFRELRLNMAGRLPLAAGPCVCPTRLGGRLPGGHARPGAWLSPPRSPAGSERSLPPSPRASRSPPAGPSLSPGVPRPPLRPASTGPSHPPAPKAPRSPAPRALAGTWGQRPAAPGPALPQRLAPHPGSEGRGQDRFKTPCCCSWGGGLRVKYF